MKSTKKCLHETIDCTTALDITHYKRDAQNFVLKQKCIDYTVVCHYLSLRDHESGFEITVVGDKTS